MKHSSRLLLIGAIPVLVVCMVVVWPRGDDPVDGSGGESAPNMEDVLQRARERELLPRQRPSKFAREEPVPLTVDSSVLARYTPENEAKFYEYSDMGQMFKEAGYTNFFTLMRGALSGDADALAGVFNAPQTDGAATEGYQGTLMHMVPLLGDEYFAYHLGKQPYEVQRRILRLLFSDQAENIAAGVVGQIHGQKCPRTSRLLRLLPPEDL